MRLVPSTIMEVIACYARRPRLVSQPGPVGVPSVFHLPRLLQTPLSRTWRLINQWRGWQRGPFTGLEPLLGTPPSSANPMVKRASFRPSHPTSANRRSSCFCEVECVYGVEPVRWKHASVRFAETVQCSQGPQILVAQRCHSQDGHQNVWSWPKGCTPPSNLLLVWD